MSIITVLVVDIFFSLQCSDTVCCCCFYCFFSAAIHIRKDSEIVIFFRLAVAAIVVVVVAEQEIKLGKAILFIFILAFRQSLLHCTEINVEIRERKKTFLIKS